METKPELTICSVYYSSTDRELLELNWNLVSKLNPAKNWTWLVTDNAPPELSGRVDEKKFRVVPGVRKEDVPKYARPWMRGSYHHTMAIQNSLPHITTRFTLFLDGDFYIVRPDWVREIIRHMRKNNLAFFGVPWHPRHVKKYRYFPTIHSLFVDFDHIDRNSLNFIPQYEEMLKPSTWTRVTRSMGDMLFAFLSHDRRSIGTSHDSGYEIFRRYRKKRDVIFECPLPVFKSERDLKDHPAALSRHNGILEKFLPDRFCFIPKRKRSYTEVGFSERGYFNAAGKGWEEFVWQGKPFGFHLRGSHRRGTPASDNAVVLKEMIRAITPGTLWS